MTQQNYFNSSALESGSYSPEQQLLVLTFRGNRSYAYSGIQQCTWESLIRSESAGQYFNDFIRGQAQGVVRRLTATRIGG